MRWLGWLAGALLAACSTEPSSAPEPESSERPARRIVTLAPHLTELVYTAGAGYWLAGVSAWSDYPPAAAELPRIGDAFRVDLERVAQIAPDLILAWDTGNPPAMIDELRAAGHRVEVLPAARLVDVPNSLRAIGTLTGTRASAGRAAADFEQQLAALRARYRDALPLTVFYQISAQPLYTVGGSHPISEIIALCGGQNLFDDVANPAPVVTREAVIAGDPDVIVAGAPPGQPGAETWSRWETLRAVRRGNLYRVDPSLITRSSVRVLAGAAQMCAALDEARGRRSAATPTPGPVGDKRGRTRD